MRSMFVSRSSFEKPRPFERCVRTVSPSRYSTMWPRAVELGPDEVRDRRLARAREAGEPEREAAAADGVGLGVLVRVDVVGHASPCGWCRRGCRTRACRSRPSGLRAPPLGGGRPRAGDAADRAVARLVQRVVGNLVDVDVGPDALLVPVGERVDLPDAVALGPLRPSASARGSATGRGGCRRSTRRTARAREQRLDLADVAAAVGVALPEVRPLLLVLLGDRDHVRA